MKTLTLRLTNTPDGYLESVQGWIAAHARTDDPIYAELGNPRIRASDKANVQMARFRRTELDRVCARLHNPVINEDQTFMTVEIEPTGPYGHLVERFFDTVTLGARMSQRRGIVENITHIDIIPCKELKEIIHATKPVFPLTGVTAIPSRAVGAHLRRPDQALQSGSQG